LISNPEGMLRRGPNGPTVHVQVEGRHVVLEYLLDYARDRLCVRVMFRDSHDSAAWSNLLNGLTALRRKNGRSGGKATANPK
jgi:hypothetical protein